MKNKILLSLFGFFVCGLFALTQPAYCNDQTPDNLVRDFYIWYLGELNKSNYSLAVDDEIYKYIHPCVVSKLRIEHKTASRDFDYFIQSNDYWPETSKYITVGKAIKINDEVSIVPLGFEETKEKSAPRLVIFVQNEKGTLYITKVEPVYESYLSDQFYYPGD